MVLDITDTRAPIPSNGATSLSSVLDSGSNQFPRTSTSVARIVLVNYTLQDGRSCSVSSAGSNPS